MWWIVMSYIGWGENKPPFIRIWNPRFKAWRESTWGRSHIYWRKETKGVDCDIPHWLGENKPLFITGVETFPY